LKRLTSDSVVVLGRKSYDSMAWYYDRSGRPMPAKVYIVVTRNKDFAATRDNIRVALSPEDALKIAGELGKDVYVIGGEKIFDALLPAADRVYLTDIDADIEGDARFPELSTADWAEVERAHVPQDEKNEYASDQIVLDRKR
jgi:dihydrofolate reductase